MYKIIYIFRNYKHYFKQFIVFVQQLYIYFVFYSTHFKLKTWFSKGPSVFLNASFVYLGLFIETDMKEWCMNCVTYAASNRPQKCPKAPVLQYNDVVTSHKTFDAMFSGFLTSLFDCPCCSFNLLFSAWMDFLKREKLEAGVWENNRTNIGIHLKSLFLSNIRQY